MTSTTNNPEEEERRRKKNQQDLDSILDAALDELDDDSDGDGDWEADVGSDGGFRVESNGKSIDDELATASLGLTPKSTGTIAQIEVEAAPLLEESESKPKPPRPVFGPEPPPPSSHSSKNDKINTSEKKNSRINHKNGNDDVSAEEAELAASLEGMMHDFLRATGGDKNSGIPNEKEFNGMAELENVEKELEDIFRQMMIMEGSNGVGELEAALGGLGEFPGSDSKKSDSKKSKPISKAKSKSMQSTTNAGVTSSGKTIKKSDNEGGPKKAADGSSKNQPKKLKRTSAAPTVDESIDKLLDNMNKPTTNPNFDPNLMPDMSNFDPSKLEQFSEEMMNSVMKDMEKLNSKQDADQMVDGVMKQLLNKDLMYEPMKQVMLRFPKWLAENKEELSEEEYQRYGTQYQYFQRIVRVYETEPDNFPRLMELMQDIQEFGQPPVDIIKELAPELNFDDEGVPIMDAAGMSALEGMQGMHGMVPPFPGNEQCAIM
ncbi:hypothetical protein ACHAXS_002542 [Conticribra weissflogii]